MAGLEAVVVEPADFDAVFPVLAGHRNMYPSLGDMLENISCIVKLTIQVPKVWFCSLASMFLEGEWR